MFDTIRADIRHKLRWFYEDAGTAKKLTVLLQPGTIAVVVYRYGSWVYGLRNRVLRTLLAVPYWIASLTVFFATHVLIWPGATIGKGFVLHNFGTSILIGDGVIMGENCIVYQGVNIAHLRHYRGRGRRKGRTSPRIGNNVLLAAGCKVLGDITIGDNAVVGANSLVITSVPANCTVLGVPAKPITRNNRWIAEKLAAAAARETAR
jgi:serine O-acetyltransferase